MRYASLREGLVGAWCPSVSGPYGYRLPDLSGYGKHGDLISGPTWTCNTKPSITFDGTGYANIPYFNFGNVWSFSIWAEWTSGLVIFGSRSTTSSNPIQLQLDNINGGRFIIRDNVGNEMLSQVSISGSSLRHIVVTRNESTGKIWGNGVLRNTVSKSIGTIDANRINIGATVAGSTSVGFGIVGFVDDVRIYNRILTDSEIRLLASERGIGLKPERIRNRYSSPATTNTRNRSSRFLGFPA